MNITYYKLTASDQLYLTELIRLYEDVFEMQDLTIPEPGYLRQLLAREHIIFYVALSDAAVVGGLTAHILYSTYYPSAEVYVYDLAVKTDCQRKGIGAGLMAALQDHCRKLGMREVFVQADLVDKHAIDFYTKTGGKAEDVVHFTYDLTEPGRNGK